MDYQYNKRIIWGINSENKKFGLGETFCLTPLFRYNRKSEMHFLNNEHGNKCASVFDGMCDIKIFDDPKLVNHQVLPYGDISKQKNGRHQILNFLEMFGIEHDNYIPWIDLQIEDLTRAKKLLANYKNPITIAPVSGGFSVGCSNALSRMISTEEWQKIVDYLNNSGFDVIYITAPNNTIPLKDVNILTDFNYRELAAIMKICGIHIGVENGLFHAAVASGAKCLGIVPSFGWNGHLFFDSFAYTENMWIHEPNRVKYYLFDEINKLIKDLDAK